MSRPFKFISSAILSFMAVVSISCRNNQATEPTPQEDRQVWVDALVKIATPVLQNLADGTLKQNFPYESLADDPDRKEVSYLEAVGRTVCGIAPWLELGPDDTP